VVLNVRGSGENAHGMLRRLIEDIIRSKESFTLIPSYDVESIITAGIVARAFRSLDVNFVIAGEELKDRFKERVIGINISLTCKKCVQVNESPRESVERTKETTIIRLKVISDAFRRILSEYVIIPREIRYLILSSILSKYTPRALTTKIANEHAKIIDEALKEELIVVIPGPQLMGWGITHVTNSLKYSIDIIIPKYFLSDIRVLDVKLSNEELVALTGLSTDALMGNNYVIKDNWVVRDLMHLAYILIHAIDTLGVNASILAVNPARITWIAQEFMNSLVYVKKVLDLIMNKQYERVGKVIRVHLVNIPISKISLSVLSKIVRGLRILSRDELLALMTNSYTYVSLQEIKPELRSLIISKAAKILGGYVALKEEEFLELGSKL